MKFKLKFRVRFNFINEPPEIDGKTLDAKIFSDCALGKNK